MRFLLTILLLLMVSTLAFAQRPNTEYVTDQDVRIRFPGAAVPGEEEWFTPTVISITYSTDPIGPHINKVKLGPQGWEFKLQADMVVYEKCRVVIELLSIPQGFRIMELQVRVREDTSNGTPVPGPWSDANSLKVIGKPGNPFHTGE